jgi:hypothetical protein
VRTRDERRHISPAGTVARPLFSSGRARGQVFRLRPSNRQRSCAQIRRIEVRSEGAPHCNNGQNASTARWRPWFIDTCIEFRTEAMALRFEKYLKSGSGHAFAHLHFKQPM